MHGSFNFRNRQSPRNFKLYSVKSIPRMRGWWTKSYDRTNHKKQLAFTVHGERRLRRIVPSQRSQTLAQMTIQLNDGASRSVSKRTVQSLFQR
ncbi:HTH_Tnp_Tc3_2 domain-containing protein [Trichonephila clavipes]|nr:HTH_Tnp_Tc3_2 domain-containing protein [Trichonephila clavipes]